MNIVEIYRIVTCVCKIGKWNQNNSRYKLHFPNSNSIKHTGLPEVALKGTIFDSTSL